MLTPGPDHPITCAPATTRWRARYKGHVIADSADAIVLQEANYRPVVYFPKDDVEMGYFARTEHHTTCPYKGEASYFTLRMHSDIEENVAWSYEAPYDAVGLIRERLAFYPDRVEVYAVDDAAVNPHHHEDRSIPEGASVDEIVQHTDAGDGRSQREPWPPNVETPGQDGGIR